MTSRAKTDELKGGELDEERAVVPSPKRTGRGEAKVRWHEEVRPADESHALGAMEVHRQLVADGKTVLSSPEVQFADDEGVHWRVQVRD